MRIGLIKEGKSPADNRVALTPSQCKLINEEMSGVEVFVESSPNRCFSDQEYKKAGVQVMEDISFCDVLMGIKEVPVNKLVDGKTYLFFSHTRKKQPYNQNLFRAILDKNITLIDYECLEHEDGQRILGFGFFAGVVGAHNGMMAYGNRTGDYNLVRVYQQKNLNELVHTYFGLRIPPVKIAVTGSGRVAHGIVEIMNLMGIHEVEPEDYLKKSNFEYPVYTNIKGAELYKHKITGDYNRADFHDNPADYECSFLRYAQTSDILMNGIYWEPSVPRLFNNEDINDPNFRLSVIADITDDAYGSVPINLGDHTIEDPVYGVDRVSLQKTAPGLEGSIDVMAVGNLPNELPRDASRYFGEQLIKHVIGELGNDNSALLKRATMVKSGNLAERFDYLKAYSEGN